VYYDVFVLLIYLILQLLLKVGSLMFLNRKWKRDSVECGYYSTPALSIRVGAGSFRG